jgi:pimeloyl-ACP methyl ester carboxylesterase
MNHSDTSPGFKLYLKTSHLGKIAVLTMAISKCYLCLRFGNKMFGGTMKRLALLIAIGLFVQLSFCSPAQSASEDPVRVKELNFVFLHGADGCSCDLQLLADSIKEQLPAYTLDYEQANPGTSIQVDTLKRCYPSDVDVKVWANNIAASIEQHFRDKKNLILIGHSAGGKAALYAVAHNVGGLTDKVALVVTINSPIKSLEEYYATGGGSVMDYCRARWLLSDQGICNSIAYYDSSQDGSWVGSNKHWLAFISAESAPYSVQFNPGGIDGWPRDMDDSAIPISAQYADGADVIYYGEYSHSDFTESDEVAGFMAEQILRYIFGGAIECSVFARGGTFEHKANWLLGTDYWQDVVGAVLVASGRLEHKNESYFKWQEWEDVVGERPPEGERSSYQVSLVNSFLFLTSIQESYWLSPDNPEDYRLYLRTRAFPRSRVRVEWSIYREGLLPEGVERNHYEVEIVTGTPLTSIKRVAWVTDDTRDLRIQIWSQAESPFRWFKAEWRVYSTEIRQRKVIDEVPAELLS